MVEEYNSYGLRALYLPVREHMVTWVPQLISLCIVDMREPPIKHLASYAYHVCRGGDVPHAIVVEGVAGFEREVFVLEEKRCFL